MYCVWNNWREGRGMTVWHPLTTEWCQCPGFKETFLRSWPEQRVSWWPGCSQGCWEVINGPAPRTHQPPCEIFVKVEMMELCENCGASSIHPVIIHLLPHLHTCISSIVPVSRVMVSWCHRVMLEMLSPAMVSSSSSNEASNTSQWVSRSSATREHQMHISVLQKSRVICHFLFVFSRKSSPRAIHLIF